MAKIGDLFFSSELNVVVEITYLSSNFFCGITKENIFKHVVFVEYELANNPSPIISSRYRSMYMAKRPTVQGKYGNYDIVCFRSGLWDGVSGYQRRMATNKLKEYKEELMARTCHPSRLVEWCLDTEEQIMFA